VAIFSAADVGDDSAISFDEAGFTVSREALDSLLFPQEVSEAADSDESSETDETSDTDESAEIEAVDDETADSEVNLIGEDEEPLFIDDEGSEENEPVDTEAEASAVTSDAGENQQEDGDQEESVQEESVQEDTQEQSSEPVDNDSLTAEELLSSGENEVFKDEPGTENNAAPAKGLAEQADAPTHVTHQQEELNTSIQSID
jgi:hypothetical protein